MEARGSACQLKSPGFVIGGELRQSVPWKAPIIRINPSCFPMIGVAPLMGDPTKTKDKVGGVPAITSQEMCPERGVYDLQHARRHALIERNGYSSNVIVY